MTRAAALADLAAVLMREGWLLEYVPDSHVVSGGQLGDGWSIKCAADPTIEFVGRPANVASDFDLVGVRYDI